MPARLEGRYRPMRTVLARPDHGLGAAGRAGRCPRPGAERPAGVELQDVSKVDTPPAPAGSCNAHAGGTLTLPFLEQRTGFASFTQPTGACNAHSHSIADGRSR